MVLPQLTRLAAMWNYVDPLETFRLLWAVIARLDLPELDEIPDAATDAVARVPRSERTPSVCAAATGFGSTACGDRSSGHGA